MHDGIAPSDNSAFICCASLVFAMPAIWRDFGDSTSGKALNPCNSVAGPIFSRGVCGKNPSQNPKFNCSRKRLRSRQGETGETCHCRHVIGFFRVIGPGPGPSPSERRARINACLSINAGFRFRRRSDCDCKCHLDGIFDYSTCFIDRQSLRSHHTAGCIPDARCCRTFVAVREYRLKAYCRRSAHSHGTCACGRHLKARGISVNRAC